MKITIEQKMSNTGSIYDLESDQFDRVIDLGDRYRYAVVMPSYYGGRATRHTTLDLASAEARSLSNGGYANVCILDRYGDIVDC